MNASFTHSRYAAALLLPAALLSIAPQAACQTPGDDETYQGEAPERYAMVRTLEGEVRIRKGDVDEALSRGTPVGEGDVVESRGRGVLQLGDGTRIAFGGATRFTVAALFTNQKGEKQVLLRLDYGRMRVLLGGQSDARFRVDTPSGTATCYDSGSFTIEAERDNVVRLKVHSGRVSFANERDENRIAAGERLTVYSPQDRLDRIRDFNTYDGDDFDRWSERAVVIRRGESWDRVPPEIRYYADELDGHGRWVHSDEFGDVWQPAGVAEDWRPYYDGRWAPYSGGMTWISDEPWAYVAYHHGRWHWSLGMGWFWIPGVYYSPAWVAWNYTPGYYGWAPLGYYNTPCHWGYGAWGGGYAWNVVSVNYINVVNVRGRIYSDATVIRTFNGSTGGTTWTGGGRDLTPPWRRSPLVVSPAEFRNPAQIQPVFQRDVNRQRLAAYERQAQATTGRTIIRREGPPPAAAGGRPGAPAGTPGGAAARIPFEDRGRRVQQGADRPATPASPRERGFESRPRDRGRELPATPGRSTEPAPRDRGADPRGRVEDRRPDPAPRERSVEPRPRYEDRRQDPAPRERAPESRPSYQDRRPDPAPRERSEPQPRIQREERRPDPAPRPAERESRPAPRSEPAREERRESAPAPQSRPTQAPSRPSGGEGRGGGREIRR